ncbi:MAG TPA: aldo/keto reductase [Tepidisphaeraceae bacterium]|jgi:aryl-alcohol dehydrogenase-like predicted oxidoreductase|nr:aldo/keto reductase [Tepidisphaeraceae bacterium]
MKNQSMPKRALGKSSLRVAEIGLGCMGMSYAYGSTDDAESMRVLHRYVELGGNFLDTAEIYGPFKNEELVGRFLKETKREELVIATKFGFRIDQQTKTIVGADSSPENIRRACEGSLRRLGIETIDLYYQHRVDPARPIEETVGVMSELVEEGKVRELGLSEAGAETLRRAAAVHPIAGLQSEYSLWTRDPETNGVLETCRELGIGFVAYSPLGRGFLTGAIAKPTDLEEKDWRRTNPRFQGEAFEKNLELAEHVKTLAKKKGCTPAQLALAWVLAQGEDMVPIPGTKRVKYLEDNMGAVRVAFAKEELREIDRLFPPGAAVGTRYPEAMMGMVGR